MHLAEGRYDHVGRLFESVFGDIPITVGSDLQDSVALAWRLDLYGRPDSQRWKRLGLAARSWLEMPLLLFHDLHVGMALAAAGDWSAAETQLGRLRERGKKSRHPTLPEVVVPLMDDHGQSLLSFVLDLTPDATVRNHIDYYGNRVHQFHIAESHRRLAIQARSSVVTYPRAAPVPVAAASLAELRPRFFDFLAPTRRVPLDRDWAAAMGLGKKTVALPVASARLSTREMIRPVMACTYTMTSARGRVR